MEEEEQQPEEKPPVALIRKLNNYKYTPEIVSDVKRWINTKEFPETANTKWKQTQFTRKWTGFDIDDDNNLVYDKDNAQLIVVLPEDKEKILKRMYRDKATAVGSGVAQFYFKVTQKYIGILRKEVETFLKAQKVFQMTRPSHHFINKPILSEEPNRRWAIDLVDMSNYNESLYNQNKNDGYRYILTCIDFHSRFTWATALRRKTSEEVREGLERISTRAGNTTPFYLQKDNGGEFQGLVNAWLKQNNIKWINTLSYSPQSNGLIENFNSQLRKMLREIMIRNNSVRWVGDNPNNRDEILQICCDSKNSQKNTTTKQAPKDIWKPGHVFTPEQTKKTFENLQKAAAREVAKNKSQTYENGDIVRVKMTALFSNLRKLVKSGNKKYIVVPYSPEAFKVKVWGKLNDDKSKYEKQQYTLEHLNGTPLLTELKLNNPNKKRGLKRFFATDFIPITDTSQPIGNFTMKDAKELNKYGNPVLTNEQREQNRVAKETKKENLKRLRAELKEQRRNAKRIQQINIEEAQREQQLEQNRARRKNQEVLQPLQQFRVPRGQAKKKQARNPYTEAELERRRQLAEERKARAEQIRINRENAPRNVNRARTAEEIEAQKVRDVRQTRGKRRQEQQQEQIQQPIQQNAEQPPLERRSGRQRRPNQLLGTGMGRFWSWNVIP